MDVGKTIEDIKIRDLINKIYAIYSDFTIRWEKDDNYYRINQKNKQIRHILIGDNDFEYKKITGFKINTDFLRSTLDYLNSLNDLTIFGFPFEKDYFDMEIKYRAKMYTSVLYKLASYRCESRHEYGRISINKCLNDLLGLRIIVDSDEDFYLVVENICKLHQPCLKCIQAKRGDYRAIHVYFASSNYSFQWELQIWNKSDKERNIKSHREHKQGYTKWENQLK